MNMSLPDLIGRFAGLNVLVIGEAILDTYLEGSAGRLAREAPVPVVAITHRLDLPGGAANTAVNAAALGANVSFVSVAGDDAEGRALRRVLDEAGVATDSLIHDPMRQTLAKHRVLAGAQMLVRYDQGSTDALHPDAEDAVIGRIATLYEGSDAVIISDYSYGVLTPRVIGAIAALQAHMPRLLLADSRDLTRYRNAAITVAKPNYEECTRLLGEAAVQETRVRLQQVASMGDLLLERTGARLVAVTLDADGALLLERSVPPYRTFARQVREPQPAGAGDTFLSALALALAAGARGPQGVELASAAAGVVVGKERTATCSARELLEYLAGEEKCLPDGERLAARVAFHRQQGRRIVFTNGCFDILHRGHITYLNRAKALGDLLIVAVNSDASVRRLKGHDRPINALEDRLQVLAALSSVDYLVPFEEDTPEALIRVARPDIYVKGGDYQRESLPEAPLVEKLGGAVQILPYVEDHSTTDVIEKIRRTTVQRR